MWLGNTGKLTKAEIMSAMAPFGAVEEIQLKTPGATASTNSRSNVPYAFVIFAHTANAERAVDALAPRARLGARGEVTVRVGFGSDPTQSEKASTTSAARAQGARGAARGGARAAPAAVRAAAELNVLRIREVVNEAMVEDMRDECGRACRIAAVRWESEVLDITFGDGGRALRARGRLTEIARQRLRRGPVPRAAPRQDRPGPRSTRAGERERAARARAATSRERRRRGEQRLPRRGDAERRRVAPRGALPTAPEDTRARATTTTPRRARDGPSARAPPPPRARRRRRPRAAAG